MSKIVSDPVPLVSSLASIYSSAESVAKQGERWDKLASSFQELYGTKPDFVARAPGRVNLIGEHIDYVGFSVFPAAIEKDVLMAVHVSRPTSSSSAGKIRFRLSNVSSAFAPTEFTSSPQSPDEVTLHNDGDSVWANYFKVALKGLHPYLPPDLLSPEHAPAEIDVLVDGTVPPAAGLSSSAAMTTCSSIVVLQAFGARQLIGRSQMAQVAIESERLVGVNSGGMDQAASIFSVPGHALHINFSPSLSATPVKLPETDPSISFVIANTLVKADKKVTGPKNYNLRVVETWIAARILALHLGLAQKGPGGVKGPRTLREVIDRYFDAHPGELAKVKEGGAHPAGDEAAKIKWLGGVLEEVIKKEGYTREEAEEATGFVGKAFDEEYLSAFPVVYDRLAIYKRATHVLSEAERVYLFRSIATAASSSSSSSSPDVLHGLGELMNASQKSLKEDIAASCVEIDELCEIARRNGAVGSRLTGAGWGGCTVHLVPTPQVPSFISALRKDYYAKRFPNLSEEQLRDALFGTGCEGGAVVYEV